MTITKLEKIIKILKNIRIKNMKKVPKNIRIKI